MSQGLYPYTIDITNYSYDFPLLSSLSSYFDIYDNWTLDNTHQLLGAYLQIIKKIGIVFEAESGLFHIIRIDLKITREAKKQTNVK